MLQQTATVCGSGLCYVKDVDALLVGWFVRILVTKFQTSGRRNLNIMYDISK